MNIFSQNQNNQFAHLNLMNNPTSVSKFKTKIEKEEAGFVE